MRYLSVCSGIEAATVAWHPLGWQPVAFGEIEKFPCQVLAHHYPDTPNWGDMTKFKEWPDADVNVFVGGTPCQSFSVAGLRKGLDDPRGNLMLTYLAIAARYRPKWLVWENVPGVLSSDGGLDFASLLRGMGELGYGFAYRILDAQYFGVAQRRRRVFVVGYLGNWRPAAAVLFERHSLSGHPAPSREKRESAAATITTRTGVSRNNYEDCVNTFSTPAIGNIKEDVLASCITKNTGGGGETQNPAFVLQPISLAENTIGRKPENGGNGDGFSEEGPMYTLNATGVHGVAHAFKVHGWCEGGGKGYLGADDVAFTISTAQDQQIAQPVYELHSQDSRVKELGDVCSTVSATYGAGGGNVPITLMQAMAVRRLSPKECERLQGFPDNYTDIKPKGKATPDGPRYKALGNSMAVPVMAWIGKRIQEVDAICQTQKQ